MLFDALSVWGIRDPFSVFSHLLGVLMSAAGLAALLRRAHRNGASRRTRRRLTAYGLSMLFVFSASVLFHWFDWPPERLAPLKRLDHAAIFFVIAGTSSAVYGTLTSPWASRLLGATWVTALAALVVKMVLWPMSLWMSALTYAAVGWVPAGGIVTFTREVGLERLKPFYWGLFVLMLSAVVFVLEKPVLWPGVIEGHEVFHALVLIGAGLQYRFIYRHCTGPNEG